MKASAKGYQSESDVQGKPKPVAGLYHCMITGVNDSRVKKDGSALNATIVEFEVLAGSVPGQEGKSVTQFYHLSENGEENAEYCEKVSRLCMAAGILKPGEEKDVDAADLEKCQVVIKMSDYTSKGKAGVSIDNFGLGVWGVGHPDVAAVPKNMDAIKLWRDATGQAGSNGNGASNGNGSSHSPAMAGAGASVNADDI